MSENALDPRYPIGKYQPQPYSDSIRDEWINDIRVLPLALENSILNLDEAQLNMPYREGGWAIKRLIHHVADSHMNAYVRFKLALTENIPTIKPYNEKLWAELADSDELPANISLTLLHSLHARWYVIIRNMSRESWERKVFHPEYKKELTLWHFLGLYAWHGKHHTAHVLNANV